MFEDEDISVTMNDCLIDSAYSFLCIKTIERRNCGRYCLLEFGIGYLYEISKDQLSIIFSSTVKAQGTMAVVRVGGRSEIKDQNFAGGSSFDALRCPRSSTDASGIDRPVVE